MGDAAFVERYDRMILDAQMRAFYGGGDYYNVGHWDAATGSLAQACAALVRRVAAPAVPVGARALCRPGALVLGVGCGLGASTAQLAALLAPSRVIGVNLSPAQLAHARQRHDGPTFCAMDATRLGFADASVRCVVSVEAAFHFRSRFDFLVEAARVLQPGGMLLMSDMLFNPVVEPPWWVPPENARQDAAGYLRDCHAAGFVVEAMDDLTAATLEPFCEHLTRRYPATGVAQALREEVDAYVLVALRKA